MRSHIRQYLLDGLPGIVKRRCKLSSTRVTLKVDWLKVEQLLETNVMNRILGLRNLSWVKMKHPPTKAAFSESGQNLLSLREMREYSSNNLS